ncbi:hypothetical protein [Curtobacterium sp. 24E2]|nr:hypothetical protein JN350_09905 [Curtobacterium sp. 24E2]
MPVAAAQASNRCRRATGITEPSGYWCVGVTSTTSTGGAAVRASRSIPSSSSGMPITVPPALSTAR